MSQAIITNSIDDYLGNLVNRYRFSYEQKNDAVTLTAPKDIGRGYIRMVKVSDDIEIGIIDLLLKSPIISYYDDYPNTYETTYCLSGHICYSETGIAKANLNKNEIELCALPRSRGMTMIPSNERVLIVSVESKKYFYSQLPFAQKCAEYDEVVVKELLNQLMKPKRVNAKTHNYFNQIIENDIGHELKNAYLDSLGKVILLDLWQENIIFPLDGGERAFYSGFEREALLEAKGILFDNYQSPPSIPELSKMVALNEHKLKTSFRKMYGKSIYEYVRSLRMKTACHLLENADLSIGEIAGMVGYVNTSHFARAFRNEYGQNPSDFRFRV